MLNISNRYHVEREMNFAKRNSSAVETLLTLKIDPASCDAEGLAFTLSMPPRLRGEKKTQFLTPPAPSGYSPQSRPLSSASSLRFRLLPLPAPAPRCPNTE